MTSLAPRSALLLGLLSTVALAQSAPPDEDWVQLPAPRPLPPPPVDEPLPPLPPPQPLARPLGQSTRRLWKKEAPNAISLLGATTLGQWTRGEMVSLGFPLISLRFLIGLGDRFDLGVGFDSFYTVMNEPLLVARLGLARFGNWALAATFDGGYAWFTVPAAQEIRGARWLTGRRNVNLSPALVASYQGSQSRAARIFFELRYLLALDSEPYAVAPLGGVPPTFAVGHNFTARGGAELPLSSKTAFLFLLGLDVHGRSIDAPVMPQVAVGVVTSL